MAVLIEDNDYDFRWHRQSGAVLTDSAGHIVSLDIKDRVPVLSTAAAAREQSDCLQQELDELFRTVVEPDTREFS